MHKKIDKKTHLQIIAAAKMFSEGINQNDIAAQLGQSQPTISRFLEYARKMKILESRPAFLEHNVDPHDLMEAKAEYFEDQKLKHILESIVPNGNKCSFQIIPHSGDEFFNSAAKRVIQLLEKSKMIGVMWGRTIHHLINGIEILYSPQSNHNIECIPLCGDPVTLMNQNNQLFSASHLAAKLEYILARTQKYELPSLTGVPAYIPSQFIKKTQEANTLQKYIETIPGYNRIFGKSLGQPLISSIDTILTGVGIFETSNDKDARTASFIRERMVSENITSEELSKCIIGDICGILIPRKGLSEKSREFVRSLNLGWTGIKEDHVREVARKAIREDKPGVIVVAKRAAKASMICTILELGYANHIIIDLELANEIKKITKIGSIAR